MILKTNKLSDFGFNSEDDSGDKIGLCTTSSLPSTKLSQNQWCSIWTISVLSQGLLALKIYNVIKSLTNWNAFNNNVTV